MAARADRLLARDGGAAAAAAKDLSACRFFRAVNERLEQLNLGFEAILPVGDWVCECPDRACNEWIHLTVHEFAAIRERPRQFVVKHGHEAIRDAVVVEAVDRYVVVLCEGDRRSGRSSDGTDDAPRQSTDRRMAREAAGS